MRTVAAVLFLIMEPQDFPAIRGAIEGYVTAADNGEPVAEAHVVIGGGGTVVRTKTDTRGYFRNGFCPDRT